MASFPTLFYAQDPTGAWFTFNVSTGGDGFDINASAGPTPTPTPAVVDTAAITIQLKNTIEWTKRFISNRPSNIGTNVEPALTSANIILQTILGAPFRWRWNRVQTGFITEAGQQDYYIFNWIPSTAVATTWVTVDGYGNCQAVTSAGSTGTSTPAWNNTLGGTTTDGSVIWTNRGNVGESLSINYDFGWVEGAVCLDSDSNWQEISPKLWLSQDTHQDRPRFVSGQLDNGSGNITFRLMPVPDQSYPVILTLQQKPNLFTKTSETWSPIPDDYSRVYNWGLLSLMFLFADDPRFQVANQLFVSQLLGVSEGLTETEKNIFLSTWQQVTGGPIANQMTLQQGFQARSTGG